MGNLSLNSASSFLTKSDRIFLETSWLLKFEIWRVSVSINCNFSRYLHQPTVTYKQSADFSTSWHGMKFDIPLRISLYGYLRISLWQKKLIFDTINWATWVIPKMIQVCKLHTFSPEPNDVIYCLLLSRVITKRNFNFIPGAEVKIYGGAYPIPSSNHLCSTHNRHYRYIF